MADCASQTEERYLLHKVISATFTNITKCLKYIDKSYLLTTLAREFIDISDTRTMIFVCKIFNWHYTTNL